MKMNITVERMGQGHIIGVTAHIGLNPGWQEDIDARADHIAAVLADDVRKRIAADLPAKLKRTEK